MTEPPHTQHNGSATVPAVSGISPIRFLCEIRGESRTPAPVAQASSLPCAAADPEVSKLGLKPKCWSLGYILDNPTERIAQQRPSDSKPFITRGLGAEFEPFACHLIWSPYLWLVAIESMGSRSKLPFIQRFQLNDFVTRDALR